MRYLGKKIIGLREDILEKNLRDTEYLEERVGDIEHKNAVFERSK